MGRASEKSQCQSRQVQGQSPIHVQTQGHLQGHPVILQAGHPQEEDIGKDMIKILFYQFLKTD